MVKIDRTYLWLLIIQVIFKESHGAFFKMSKLERRDVNESFVRVNACRLKAVKRDITEATLRFQLKKTVYTCNSCRKNAVYLDILFKLIEKYTNANHTCPYDGELIIDRFRSLHKNLILPIPTGDYLIKLGFYNLNSLIVHLYVWFGFKELEIWEVGREGGSPKNPKNHVNV